jgi:hypothetical protein
MFKAFWGVALVALPFFFMPQALVDVRTHQNLFFWFLCFASLVMFGISAPRRSPKSWAACVGLSAGAFLAQLSIKDSLHPYVLIQWVSIGLACAVLVQMTSEFEFEDETFLLNAMAIAAVLQCAWVIANYLNVDPYAESLTAIGHLKNVAQISNEKWIEALPQAPVIGSLGQETWTAAMLGMTLPALLRKGWYALTPAVVFALYALGSAMGWGTAVVSCGAFYCLKKRLPVRQMAGMGAVLVPLVGFLVWNGGYFSDSVRFHAWGAILKLHTLKTVLIGGGPGFLEKNNLRIGLNQWLPSHNEYLELFNIWGLVGVGLFALAMSALWERRENFYRMPSVGAVFLGLAANSLGHFPMHISATALIGMVCFSLLTLPTGESYGRVYH